MRKEIQRFDDLRTGCEKNISIISNICACHGDKCPKGGFNIAQQYLVVAEEILENYRLSWGLSELVDMEFSVKKFPVEAEKIIKVQQWCLISIFSSFESALKKFVKENLTDLGMFQSKVHIYEMIQRSRKAGWINKEEEEVWLFINDIRNDLVHHNGEAQRSRRFTFPGGIEWNLIGGERPYVTLAYVPAMIKWMLGSFLEISIAAMKSSVRN